MSIRDFSSRNNSDFYVGTDMNLPGINWDLSIVSGNRDVSDCRELLDTMNDLGLEQMVRTPTRGSNVLDLVISNSPKRSIQPRSGADAPLNFL